MIKIAAHLIQPVTPSTFDEDIKMDALLTYAYAKNTGKVGAGVEPLLDIPLETLFLATDKKLPVFSVTKAFYDCADSGYYYRHRRIPESREFFAKSALSKIERATGFLKDSRLSFRSIAPLDGVMQWYAQGDAKEIEFLLSTYITHLGRNRAIGGRLEKWTVERGDFDINIKSHRPIPVSCMNDTRQIVRQTFTPPYWYRDRAEDCYVSI